MQVMLDRAELIYDVGNAETPRISDAMLSPVVEAELRLIDLVSAGQRPSRYAELAALYEYAGRHEESVMAAEMGLSALRSLDSERFPGAHQIEPLLLMRLGAGYYQAGQVETGLAYMDQAIATEDSPGNVAFLRQFRARIIDAAG